MARPRVLALRARRPLSSFFFLATQLSMGALFFVQGAALSRTSGSTLHSELAAAYSSRSPHVESHCTHLAAVATQWRSRLQLSR